MQALTRVVNNLISDQMKAIWYNVRPPAVARVSTAATLAFPTWL